VANAAAEALAARRRKSLRFTLMGDLRNRGWAAPGCDRCLITGPPP
jgi:hypothetical protein